MESSLETRLSLIVRLKNRADQAAWQEFVEIYRPVIMRLAAHRGMQHADAEDLAQQVLVSVSKAIGRWETAPHRARFRTWLHRVAQNAILNALSRGPPDRGAGETGQAASVEQQAAAHGPDSDLLRLEYRREVFRWAARQIRAEFQPETWKAFWLTAVKDRAVDEVARLLRKTRGAVYAARSRVMRRLQEKVAELALEEEP
jgi:RNA polymerase sigma-70 factor (ECF subfamily)